MAGDEGYGGRLMSRRDVRIPAPDGHSHGTLHVPDGDGSWPGVDRALTGADVEHTVEFYPARHGFAVPDNPTYDAAAEARHWGALERLYRDHLGA